MSEQPKKDSQTYISPSKMGGLTLVIKDAYKNIKQSTQVQICKDPAGQWMNKVIVKAYNRVFVTNDEKLIKALDEYINDWITMGKPAFKCKFRRLEDLEKETAVQPERVTVKDEDGEVTFVPMDEIKKALAEKEERDRTLANQKIVTGTIGTTDVKTNKKGKK